MNILNRRVYLINIRRYRGDYFVDKTFTTSFLIAYSSMFFHRLCNLFSRSDCKTVVRIYGSYVR